MLVLKAMCFSLLNLYVDAYMWEIDLKKGTESTSTAELSCNCIIDFPDNESWCVKSILGLNGSVCWILFGSIENSFLEELAYEETETFSGKLFLICSSSLDWGVNWSSKGVILCFLTTVEIGGRGHGRMSIVSNVSMMRLSQTIISSTDYMWDVLKMDL